MNTVTLARRYGLWLAMTMLVSLPGATMSGCLSEPPTAGSSAVEQSIQGDISTVTSSPIPLSCPPCPLARGQLAAGPGAELAAGPVIAAACDCTHCGDGICNFGETHTTCSPDCPLSGPVCGNGRCEAGETAASCPRDCGAVCGNGRCETGETAVSCPEDCCSQASPPCTV